MSECPVCVDTFTPHLRKAIQCPFCEYRVCQQCVRRYLLQTTQDPHCMNCMHGWKDEFLRFELPLTWIHGDFKRHREKCLFERERMRLPETQPMVSNYKLAHSLRKTVAETQERLGELRAETIRLKRMVNQYWDTIYRAEYNGYRGLSAGAPTTLRPSQVFPCPADDCRGFVDSDTGVCGVCDVKMCLKCGTVPESAENHECDQNMVLNFSAIKRQTRPCPKCAAPTFKIDGCAQMFCTYCETPWDWNTGTIVRGVIHNPHYFEWLRSQSENGEIPRQPGDVPGGGDRQRCENQRVPSGYTLYQRLTEDRRYGASTRTVGDQTTFNTMMNVLSAFCRRLVHVHEVEIRRLRVEEDNADLRLKYLLNDLTEDELKKLLQRREKKRNKGREIADVYDMVTSVGGDILWAYIREDKDIIQTHESIMRIRHYVNNSLDKIARRYNMCIQQFYV